MAMWIKRPALEWHLDSGAPAASHLVLTPCGLSWVASSKEAPVRRGSLRGIVAVERCGPCQAVANRGQEVKRARTRRHLEGLAGAVVDRRDPTAIAAA